MSVDFANAVPLAWSSVRLTPIILRYKPRAMLRGTCRSGVLHVNCQQVHGQLVHCNLKWSFTVTLILQCHVDYYRSCVEYTPTQEIAMP